MPMQEGDDRKGFRVSARTILQLGGELISSDGIAFYELIKNAVDAGSRKVHVEVQMQLRTAAAAFMAAMGGLKLPIEIPTSTEAKAIQLVDSSGKRQPIKHVALRFGAFAEAPASTNKELMFCLSAEEE